MNHREAIRSMAVDQYILDELEPEVRQEFEEHFFDCHECAADLTATAAFLDSTKVALCAEALRNRHTAAPKKSLFHFLFAPIFALPVYALLLLMTVYQYLVITPRLANEVAELKTPQILPVISLVGGNSRGALTPSVTLKKSQAFLINLDIPAKDGFSSYTCSLYSPAGSRVSVIEASAEQAKDTISIGVPPGTATSGTYTLKISGNQGHNSTKPGIDLATYHLQIKTQI